MLFMTPIVTTSKTTARPAVWAIFLRIVLGVILIWKGIKFISDTAVLELLTNQVSESMFTKNEAVIILVATLLTLIFAIFIIVGLFIRIAAFIQLPIFLIGMLFIHGGYIERYGFELIVTLIVPFLLLLFISKACYKSLRLNSKLF
jgi:uncharacterized membrane protein YphA (DoxX/SURF4 family)